MFNQLSASLQYLYPQHALTTLAGKLADARTPWLKNSLIDCFIRAYKVDMSTAIQENPHDYATFNDFFTRQLKPSLRPVAPDPGVACPVDGTLSQIGGIEDGQLLQAKHFYYDLQTLLGGDSSLSRHFAGGSFATLYLAPNNYHRVHMPLAGKLQQTVFVPGKLFSVNHATSQFIPRLYTRNERLVSVFDTAAGPMAVILVGAIIVGSIQMVWQDKPSRAKKLYTQTFAQDSIALNKGDEMGLFKLGSTVILLFAKNKTVWLPALQSGSKTVYGAGMGTLINNPQ